MLSEPSVSHRVGLCLPHSHPGTKNAHPQAPFRTDGGRICGSIPEKSGFLARCLDDSGAWESLRTLKLWMIESELNLAQERFPPKTHVLCFGPPHHLHQGCGCTLESFGSFAVIAPAGAPALGSLVKGLAQLFLQV